jgi:hypothetical protein
MTNDEERKKLVQELQYRRMRLNEAMQSLQRQFCYTQEILQATIDHMEGNDNAV